MIRMKYPRLRQMRIENHMTQKDVAEQLACSQNCYSKYERGEREMPLRYWVQLARCYRVSLDDLGERTSEKERRSFVGRG